MPEQTNPHPNWKIILAALLDFATMFAIGGYVIGKLSGQTTENGFSLSGIPALISLALIVAYFVIGNRYFGGTLWKHILGTAKPKA